MKARREKWLDTICGEEVYNRFPERLIPNLSTYVAIPLLVFTCFAMCFNHCIRLAYSIS